MIALLGTETPMPTPTMTVSPESVTPGFAGFAAIAIVLIAVFLLVWDMNRRIRRVRYREEVREELDAEEAAARGQGSDDTADETSGERDGGARDEPGGPDRG